MVFYASMGNPGGSFGGMGGNPTAFATPNLNPTYLAMLQQMQNQGANPGMANTNPAPTFPTAGGGGGGGLGGAAMGQLGNLLGRVGQPGAMPGGAGALPGGVGATPGQAGGINPQMLAYLQAMGLLGGASGVGGQGLLGSLANPGAASAPTPNNQGLLGGFFNR